jgi:hypothetical protein
MGYIGGVVIAPTIPIPWFRGRQRRAGPRGDQAMRWRNALPKRCTAVQVINTMNI